MISIAFYQYFFNRIICSKSKNKARQYLIIYHQTIIQDTTRQDMHLTINSYNKPTNPQTSAVGQCVPSIILMYGVCLIQIIMLGKSKHELNEYQARGGQLESLINSRYANAEHKQDWNYEIEVKEVSIKNKYKYQDIEMAHKIDFLDDMKNLIYDPKKFPEDLNMFTSQSDWKLIGFEGSEYPILEEVPSNAYLKKKVMPSTNIDTMWGSLQAEGKLSGKLNDTSYTSMHYNLRKRALFLYTNFEAQKQEKETLMIHFTETTFNYQSENDEFFSLKFDEKVLKIKKEMETREFLKILERMLFMASFRGVYCLRNEVPSCYVEDYVIKQVDVIKGVDFVHEHKIKDIVNSRYYKQAIGGFFYLLNKESFKHKNVSAQITLPKWLKHVFKSIPSCEINLITNVVPNKNPLMNLKIRLHESEIILLNENLKYIFPFHKNYMKRSLIIYESNLQDNQINYMMNQISYPMHTIGLPKNQLSILGLEYVINAASTLYHEVIDFSYNAKLISISGSKIFNLANSNPSIKKVMLKGCYVMLGEEQQFFQGLSNNMCLQQFQIDYMDSYNESMTKHLSNYDAEIY